MGPRTRQKWLRKVLKSGWTASVVADQYSSNWMPVKTLAGTNGAASDGSSTLFNSATEGSRQPVVPPTFLLRQSNRACNQSRVVVSGDCSHTSPVLLSRTALLLKSFRIVNRDALGRFLSQFWVTPAKGPAIARTFKSHYQCHLGDSSTISWSAHSISRQEYKKRIPRHLLAIMGGECTAT